MSDLSRMRHGVHRWAWMSWFATLLGISMLWHDDQAWGESPSLAIDAIYPPALAVGASSTMQVTAGRFTQDIEELRFSHPGIQATLESAPQLPFDSEPQKKFGSFSVHVDPGVPEGYYEVWGVGRYGVSNPRVIVVVQGTVELLPAASDAKSPIELKPGVCYVGRTQPNARQHYRPQNPGMWPPLTVVAGSLDSMAIPVVSVRDALQNAPIEQRASGSKPLLLGGNDYPSSVLPEAVEFSVHDFLFRGGEGFVFLLVLEPKAGHVLSQSSPWKHPDSLALDRLAAWPRVAADAECSVCPIVMPPPPWETELMLPAGMGRASLEFPASEGQAYECEVFAQVLEQTADLRAVVDRVPIPPETAMLVEYEKSHPAGVDADADPAVQALVQVLQDRAKMVGRDVVAVAEDGPISGTRAVRFATSDPLVLIPAGDVNKHVRLTWIDLLMNPSSKTPTKALVRIGPPMPRWHAMAHWTPDTNIPGQARTTGACLPRGGQIGVHVTVRRAGGFNGSLQVTADALPEGVSAAPAVIGAGQTETELILYADENAPRWTGPLVLTSRGSIDGQEIAVPVAGAVVAIGATSERGVPRARLTSQLMLSTIDQDLAPIQVRAGEGSTLEVAQGAAVPIPIRSVRRHGGEAKCILRPQNLPPKVAMAEFELAPNANEASPELKVAPDTAPGEYTVWFQAEMTLKQSLHPEAHARTIAYRDRLNSFLADPSWSGDRAALEKTIGETNAQIEALAKQTAPIDFPTFFSTASFRLRVVPPPEAPK